ncbi:hypothetical protein MTR_3g464100 [Medicago truncatula]|uniref:Uncharacterized protein n=1 Tax=Medicago truncatula TaxID=3880 RepID=A0A072UWS3_MEDTR|nr:hypothetical protein MTR_3g464100 [Medicago truncatula]
MEPKFDRTGPISKLELAMANLCITINQDLGSGSHQEGHYNGSLAFHKKLHLISSFGNAWKSRFVS